MQYSLAIKTAPAGEPLALAVAKRHLLVDDDLTDQDALITALIVAAREWVENYCRRSLVRRVYELRMDCFPDEIRLPRGPAIAVVDVTYLDAGGNEQTLDAANYQVDLYSMPARIQPVFGGTWPTPKFGTLNAVTVEYSAGYEAGSPDNDYGQNVPNGIKQAMLLIIGFLYENRGEAVNAEKLPPAVKFLLAPYEVRDYTLE